MYINVTNVTDLGKPIIYTHELESYGNYFITYVIAAGIAIVSNKTNFNNQ